MLRIKNRHIDWAQHRIVNPAEHTKDGRTGAYRSIRTDDWPPSSSGAQHWASRPMCSARWRELQDSFKTAWESLLLVANGHSTERARPGVRVGREQLRQIDLHWHDLRHEGACRLLAEGTIQLMLGHSDIRTTQRYLNITDEELRKALTGVWERRRQQLKAVGQ